MIENVSATPGMVRILASTSLITCAVRGIEAPSGSWTETKNPPWSSLGRNPPGMMPPSPTMPAAQTPIATRARMETRSRRRTTPA